MKKPTETDTHEKVYFLIKRKTLDLFITNRPNKNIEEIEYTDNKNNARRFDEDDFEILDIDETCLLYTSPSPRDKRQSRMPSSA